MDNIFVGQCSFDEKALHENDVTAASTFLLFYFLFNYARYCSVGR